MPELKIGAKYNYKHMKESVSYVLTYVSEKGNILLTMSNGHEFVISRSSFDHDFVLAPRKKIKRWVNLYPEGVASHWKTKTEADGFAVSHRLACVEVEFEEE